MVLGLERGKAMLVEHNPEWEKNAYDTIQRLWSILSSIAIEIQHIGSTSIRHIKAKPVIDIVVSVQNFEEVLNLTSTLEKEGFMFVGWDNKEEGQPAFQCGEYDPKEKNMQLLTHYIHFVIAGSQNWKNYINFRDYMNAFPTAALEYEKIKLRLSKENRNDYNNYFKGKQKYLEEIIKTVNNWDDLGRKIDKTKQSLTP